VLPELETLDIVGFNGQKRRTFWGWVARRIGWFSRDKGEPPTVWTHVGPMYDGEHICEALGKVMIHPLAPRLAEPNTPVEIYRIRGVTDAQKATAQLVCEEYKGRRYGWWKIALHAVGLRKLAVWEQRPICSLLLADVVNKALGRKVFELSAQPDCIHDICKASEDIDLIYSTEG